MPGKIYTMNYLKLSFLLLISAVIFSSCKKVSTPTPAPTQPVTPTGVAFTLGGDGSNCTGATLSGDFITGTALLNNTATIQVNVTSVGDYSITTDTVNGMNFNKTGTFTTTGIQNIILTGTGTPIAAGTNNYLIHAGSDSCSVSITCAPQGTLTCKFNGVTQDFSNAFRATLLYNAGINFKVYGNLTTATNTNFEVWIQHPSINPLTTGTYTVGMGNNFYVKGQYTDAVFNYWMDDGQGPAHTDPFTVTITSVSSTVVTGTFSGIIEENAGFGPSYITVTDGAFTAPLSN